MRAFRRFFARIWNFSAGRRANDRLREEMDEHVAMQTEENLRAGMELTEARRQALVKWGAAVTVREQYQAERGLPGPESLLQDLRFAARMLRKSPVFTIVAVLTLALGIGANGAIFTLMNAFMLKNMPVADPKSLVRLGNNNDCCVGYSASDAGEFSFFSTNTYEYLRKNTPEFQELAAMQAGFSYRPVVARQDGTDEAARSVMGEFVSGNYFNTFGLTAAAGRLFEDRDDVIGVPLTAVMSYATWRTRYHGDRAIVGSTFRINTKPVTIIGIAPDGFYGDRLMPSPPEFYFPIETMPPIANVPYVHGTETQWLYIVGRVRPGVSLPQLEQKVSALLRQQQADTAHFTSPADQERLKRFHIVLTPGGAGIQAMQKQYDKHLTLLMWVSAIVLLIACANLANLLLVRGMARKPEVNLRTALGARRGRIVRQLLTESLLLASLGGIAGLVVAYSGTRMLLAFAFPAAENMPIDASPSATVLAFAFGLSLLTGVLFGVAPAFVASKASPVDALRSGMRSVSGGASLLQKTLVVTQAGLSLVLLVGAGLFAKSLSKLEHIDLKLDPTNRYIVHINPQTAGYSQRQVGDLYRAIEERFHALPGVDKVGITSFTPMEDNNNGWGVQIQGRPDARGEATWIKANADYFDSVGTRVVMGRGIRPDDTADSHHIAVVNQEFVRQLFKPGENPLGQHFGFGGNAKAAGDWEIVGVVENTAYQSATWKNHMMYFVPPLQRPLSTDQPIEKDENMYAGAIVLKTTRPIPEMEELSRKTLAAINPNLSVVRFQSFSAQIAEQFGQDRMLSRLTMLFGALALLLATLGLYGVTAYGVARRTAEIGIRMALGAARSKVTAMVMRGAMLQAIIGLALGIPASIFCVRYIQSQLYEIKTMDAMVLAAAVLTLVAAATLAGWIPARRAASINPVQALRVE